MNMADKPAVYEHVIPNIEDWPIYKLSEDRRAFIEEIIGFTLEGMMKNSGAELTDTLAKTIYLERIRMKEEPWKVDPPNEKQFWRKIQRKLVGQSLDRSAEEALKANEEILGKIVRRYAEEIVGTFRIKAFLFARRFLTIFFTRLLNTAASRNWRGLWGSKYRLQDRLMVNGQVEQVRELIKKGTVVIVPTHFSNLDSILIGYAMDAFAGLPSFSYGAGLNLYNTGYTAYFMNRLGAYRVDRRKKNAIYLETLKAMSNLSIQRGVNSLFFPGGTRSRSGSIETKLKLGLMSSVLEAQRAALQKGEGRKIFIVPLIISYHFVLEAPFLIEQHLKIIGKERYIKAKDDFYSGWKLLKFTWKVFSKSNDITLSFGQPLDVLGNPVDMEGNSHDKYGNLIDLKDYFSSKGKVVADLQRESEYTKILGEKILERYFKDNIVLSSHIVAFAAFEILKHQNSKLDLYGILRLPTDDYTFPMDALHDVAAKMQAILIEMEKQGDVRLSEQIYWPADRLLQDGVARLGTYHLAKPLRVDKNGQILSDSFKVLYFYHNRLEGYGLAEKMNWKKYALEMA